MVNADVVAASGLPGSDGSADQQPVRALYAVLSRSPGGLTGPELLEALRRRWPGLAPPQLRGLIDSAGTAVRMEGDRFFASNPAAIEAIQVGSHDLSRDAPGLPPRAVALDMKTVLRMTQEPPYVERAVWQVGAMRFGQDRGWVAANPRMAAWVELPAGYVLRNPAAPRHRAAARPPASAFGHLSSFCEGADILVAHNDTGLDFGILDDACDRAGVGRIDAPDRVDARYLAYTWWPTAGGFRLRDLAAAAGADVSGLSGKDAADDAEVLARLIVHGAATVSDTWSSEFARLVASVPAGSAAWRLMFGVGARRNSATPVPDAHREPASNGPDTPNGRSSADGVRSPVNEAMRDYILQFGDQGDGLYVRRPDEDPARVTFSKDCTAILERDGARWLLWYLDETGTPATRALDDDRLPTRYAVGEARRYLARRKDESRLADEKQRLGEMETIEVSVGDKWALHGERFVGRWLVEPDPKWTRASDSDYDLDANWDPGYYWGVALTARGRVAVYAAQCNGACGSLTVFDSLAQAHASGAVPMSIVAAARQPALVVVERDI